MKRIVYILALFILAAAAASAQQVCCPAFKLVPDMQPCDSARPYGQGTPYEQENKCDLLACKHTTQTYRIIPANSAYTYTWTVTGGTAAAATGNPMKITWGNSDEGSIKIFVHSQDGTCRDTITKKVCLKDAPVANFSFTPGTPVCLNQAIQFTNTSAGAASYYWDFGDGTSSDQANPIHSYTTPGTYTIILAVSNKPPALQPDGPVQEYGRECGCTDTLRRTITVKNESGITILPGCKQMLCKGDTASYCTTNQCNSYNWSVTGGHIIGSSTGKCINVAWDGSYPATVTLSGNCGGACGNSGTINVPVLYPSMPIQGTTLVCPSSVGTYTLPAMPGTFYSWQLGSGGTIVGADSNTSVINVLWGTVAGNYTISCNYHNPITGCSGSATIDVSVKPKFQVTGPSIACTGTTSNYTVTGGGNANWTIAPATGYTPSGTFTNVPNTGLAWNAAGTYTINATPVNPGNYCTPSATINTIVNPVPVLNVTGPATVCPAQVYTYSVTSNTTGGIFSWFFTSGTGTVTPYGPGNSSSSISFTGTGPWTLQATQTVNGCSGSTTMAITKVPSPPPITIIPAGNTCSGGTVTASVTGALPPGGYTWSSTPGAVLTGGQGTTTATFTVNSNATITVSSCGGNSTLTVTTVATPVTISQTSTTCGAVLTASPGGGTYHWFLNGNPAGNSNPLTVTQNGTYTVEAHYGPCVATSQVIVTGINPIVASISATGSLCNGGVVTLQAPIPANCPGATFTWSNGATGNPITVSTPGNYFATIHCSNGCTATSNVISISTCQTGGNGCINDLTISPSNCPNPVALTTNIPSGCTPVSTSWTYGDGHSGATGNHTYTNVGAYTVYASVSCSNGTVHCGTQNVTVPMVDSFTSVINCGVNAWTIQLQDASMYLPAYAGYSITWATTCGTLSATNTPNPVLTVTPGCNPTVTLTISKNGCTLSKSFTYNFPATPLTINGGPAVCKDVPAVFSSSFTTGVLSYTWNFGDATTGVTNPISHAYNGTPLNPVVSLTITDQYGCTFTATKNIAVNVPTPLTITPSPLVKICPGCSVPVTLSTNPATGFTGYQWYQNGTAIAGATNSTYQLCNNAPGNYYVTAISSNNNCPVTSDSVTVVYNALPVADIQADAIQCTGTPVRVQNIHSESGVTYSWTATGPAAVSFSPANSYMPTVTIAGSVPGQYQFILTATGAAGCVSKDTLCLLLVQSPTVAVTAPAGPLCEGQVYTFTATASPNISPENYFYQWNNGTIGNTLLTGRPGMYSVTAQNPSGCKATAFAGTIKSLPDISLFPVGCDTLCWTDTLRFPLPQPGVYSVSWYDNDGTALANVGNGFILPLSNLQPGPHHLYATVSQSGGCTDTTGIFDLYVKDCNLPPACDNCTGLLESASLETNNHITTGATYQVIGNNLTITILKPAKEVRISLADLKYYWQDTTCATCKVQMIERGCLFAAAANQSLGTLLPDNGTAVNLLSNAPVTNCPGELVWKNGTPLQPGTYTIPLQLSVPKTIKDKCRLILDKLCFHVTVIDEDCNSCDTRVCKTDIPDDGCRCNAGNYWTSLYLLPKKPGIPKPRDPILCNSTLTGFATNTPYVLSGLYHCQGPCPSVTNEITVYNQVNDIIYTRVTAALNEPLLFPSTGMYSVTLAAHCGLQKCVCSFRIYIADTIHTDTVTTTTGGGGGDTTYTPTTEIIDSVIHTILPPDFNGGILISKNDTILYEKYTSYKHPVTSHTAFDLASITKTFTAMAILKLMEEGKLSVDHAVIKYLPEFPIPEITIKMLLSHKSGLEDYLAFMDESGWDKTRNVTNKDLLQFIAANKSKVLINTPGKVFNYSNTNFALLALIIEKISGLSYKDYLSAAFFTPLQMNDTYVLGLDNFSTATKSYYKNGTVYKLRYLDLVYGDKNVYSTVQDLKKWDKALREGRLFKKSTLDLAYAPTSPLAPFVSNYGLGWKKIVTDSGKEILYHTGWWAGSRSILIRLVEEKTVIAVVSNNNFTNIADIRKLCDLFGNYQQSGRKIAGF